MIDEEHGSELDLCDSLPFMESFPFTEYSIVLQEVPGMSAEELGINPMVINEVGDLESNKRVNFAYISGESTIMVSFYLDDITYIEANQHLVKKLDSVLKDLDSGLSSSDPHEKIKMIKKGRAFVRQLKSISLDSPAFEEVLLDICEIIEVNLASNIILDLQKLNTKGSLKGEDLTKRERDAITTYLDFQLHYSKIVLGVLIAAKIY